MRAYDIIAKKRHGLALSRDEIEFMVMGGLEKAVPDYQLSAFLMAVCINGMTDEETSALCDVMVCSGETADLSSLNGITADKHSTGGVGDKTTLIVAPVAASCGLMIAKMSGRGLGYTGGTIDKLEAIPGMHCELSTEQFLENVRHHGICVVSQTASLAPADGMLYALRDVTATVDSIPLIASSIMSKKIALGSNCILLDVKTGSGAFMKTDEEARELARLMVDIGIRAGRRTAALISDMDVPLGCAIGNSLEVIEAVHTLSGKGPEDLLLVSIELSAMLLALAGKGSIPECREMASEAIESGKALDKLCEMVAAQGGDTNCIRDTSLFAEAPFKRSVTAPCSGWLYSTDAEKIGLCSVALGAGREKKSEAVDSLAGIIMKKKPGDSVVSGEEIAILAASSEQKLDIAQNMYLDAVSVRDEKPLIRDHIIDTVFPF